MTLNIVEAIAIFFNTNKDVDSSDNSLYFKL